ncbi:MAG: NTP transferase domain-containing protein, partial [Alphaproteobacteria bacterium]|nr:NTP transferase domain-containing protein [Alphaproteobacteria bacterium]
MTSLQTAIIIPARYGSTRFAGKPLALLKGKTVLEYVVNIARTACEDLSNVSITVATDDERISNFCQENSIPFLMTPAECKTGTDRAMAAAHMLETTPDLVINLQGDAPFTPPDFVKAMIDEYIDKYNLPHRLKRAYDALTRAVEVGLDEAALNEQLDQDERTLAL